MALAIAIAGTGCNPLLGITTIAGPPDGFVADTPDAFVCHGSTPVDPFTSTPPCGTWGSSSVSSGVTMKIANGMLTITTVPAGNGAVGGCSSSGTTPFTRDGVFVHVPQVSSEMNVVAVLSLSSGTAETVGMTETGGTLSFATQTMRAAQVPYTASAMQWWRIRPDNNGIVADFSPDGLTWTMLGTAYIAAPADVHVGLIGGTQGPTAMTDSVSFA